MRHGPVYGGILQYGVCESAEQRAGSRVTPIWRTHAALIVIPNHHFLHSSSSNPNIVVAQDLLRLTFRRLAGAGHFDCTCWDISKSYLTRHSTQSCQYNMVHKVGRY